MKSVAFEKLKRKKLYLGLKAPLDPEIFHYPIIKIAPLSLDRASIVKAFKQLPECTHLLFTSQSAVELFFKALSYYEMSPALLKEKVVIAIGQATKASLLAYGLSTQLMPKEATSEGVIALISQLPLQGSFFFWPHSALSREVIIPYLKRLKIPFVAPKLYTSEANDSLAPLDIENFDEIIFTSPSTVSSFLKLIGPIPLNKKITAIGPVTLNYLQKQALFSLSP